jgi:serine/threonine protein kinase
MNEERSVGLKDFNVVERLGKGSFGSVYLVEKISNTEIYAMKVLEKEKILKQNLVRYAMTERNVLCLAKHPFIVSLNYAF